MTTPARSPRAAAYRALFAPTVAALALAFAGAGAVLSGAAVLGLGLIAPLMAWAAVQLAVMLAYRDR